MRFGPGEERPEELSQSKITGEVNVIKGTQVNYSTYQRTVTGLKAT